jgi:hypothetical protein
MTDGSIRCSWDIVEEKVELLGSRFGIGRIVQGLVSQEDGNTHAFKRQLITCYTEIKGARRTGWITGSTIFHEGKGAGRSDRHHAVYGVKLTRRKHVKGGRRTILRE